jgi:hypothetical protein
MGHFGNIRARKFPHGDYCSPTVTRTTDPIGDRIQAAYVTSMKLPRSFC